jgi:hypothetical protein
MYLDSLTVTALVIFVGALWMFIRFCMVRVCGLKSAEKEVASGNESKAGNP